MKKHILMLCAVFLSGWAASADFSGSWGYTKNISDGVYRKYFNIKQSPNYMITGEWHEGYSDGASGSGKVKGYVKKGGRLYLSYCSEGGNSWYTPCPKYEQDRGYFVRWNGGLVEYYRPYGKGAYRKGDTLSRQKESEAAQVQKGADVSETAVQEPAVQEPAVQEPANAQTGRDREPIRQTQMPQDSQGGDVFDNVGGQEEKGGQPLTGTEEKVEEKQETPKQQEPQNGQVFAD